MLLPKTMTPLLSASTPADFIPTPIPKSECVCPTPTISTSPERPDLVPANIPSSIVRTPTTQVSTEIDIFRLIDIITKKNI